MVDLDQDQLGRYSRQILLPDVGEAGQKKLLAAKVLVIGLGGLGSPVAEYLVRAGVGTLGIVDSDSVEVSNLHRQTLFNAEDIGKKKTAAAQAYLHKINPDVLIIPHDLRLKSNNIMAIINDYDVVVDGSDNYPTRYLINDACVLSNKILVHGAFLRFEGQVTVIKPRKGPCFRCLFPEPPPNGAVPSCQEAGVLGALAGVIGSIMAAEALKLIIGIGESLVGELLVFDSLGMNFRKVKISRNSKCPVCNEKPTIKELIDYDWFYDG